MADETNDQEAEGVVMSTAISACAKSFESETCRERSMLSVPCHVGDPDLWFAENPLDLERAKALCADCPIRRECLPRRWNVKSRGACGVARSSSPDDCALKCRSSRSLSLN